MSLDHSTLILFALRLLGSFYKFQSHNKLIGVKFKFALICSSQMQISGRKETLMILFRTKNVSRQQVSQLENYSGHHSTPPIRSSNNVFLVFILSGVPLFHFAKLSFNFNHISVESWYSLILTFNTHPHPADRPKKYWTIRLVNIYWQVQHQLQLD